MKRGIVACGVAVAFALGTGLSMAVAGEEHAQKTEGPKCVVMSDESANLAVSVATDEGPVFFCCPDCIKKYEANPAKYAANVTAQRKVLAKRPKVQVTCPVSGKAANKKVYIEHDGQNVYFCCQGCVPKYKADAAKFKSSLANSFSYQTKCPVGAKEIDPQVSTKLPTGQTIYFCCKGCDTKFIENPGKYAPKLAAQSVYVDPAKIKAGGK